MLAEVIEPRIEELYNLVQAELRRSGFEELLSSGIVLTGGSAQLAGMTELGEEVFHLPVRVGVPQYMGGLADVVRNPRYATAVGLLLEGREQFLRGQAARAGERAWRRGRADEAVVQGEFLVRDQRTEGRGQRDERPAMGTIPAAPGDNGSTARIQHNQGSGRRSGTGNLSSVL
jgi:cell division ATPase FtsA